MLWRIAASTNRSTMRTTIKRSEDAAIAARNVAQRERLSLGEAISELVRRGASVSLAETARRAGSAFFGRFALPPARDEVVTPQRVRELMERKGI